MSIFGLLEQQTEIKYFYILVQLSFIVYLYLKILHKERYKKILEQNSLSRKSIFLAVFYPVLGGFGSNFSSLGKLSMGFSFSIDAYDNFGNRGLFEGISGQSMDYSVGYLLMGTRSIPVNGNNTILSNGVYRHSIGIGTGVYMTNSNTVRLW